MTPFARYFKLKDPQRNDFRLNPDRDARLYVDLDSVTGPLAQQLGDPAPKGVIQGDFGTGKSHVLRYIEHVIAPQQLEPVYILLSGFNRRSDFYSVHQQIMGPLLSFTEAMMREAGANRALVRDISYIGNDMQRALESLSLVGYGGIPNSDAVAAAQWLSDSRLLTSAKAAKAGYGGTLREKASPSDLVRLYRAIGALCKAIRRKSLLLLVDEGESFTVVVDADAQASIGAGMRGLFDPENDSVGIFLGLNTPRLRAGIETHPMLRRDVRSRVGTRMWPLLPLTTPERVNKFMRALWPNLTEEPETNPFLLDILTLDFLARRLDDIRKRLQRVDDLTPDPTPRDLLEVLSHIGLAAIQTNVRPPIRAVDIARWLGLKVG